MGFFCAAGVDSHNDGFYTFIPMSCPAIMWWVICRMGPHSVDYTPVVLVLLMASAFIAK